MAVLALAACFCVRYFSGGRDDPATPVLAASTPSPAPEATPEPTPAPIPTAEPTPEPTPEPVPSADPSAEPTALPTPTPGPTEEPSPEPTEEPTPEPSAEPTPEPSAEPTPEPTAEPSPEPTPAPTQAPTDLYGKKDFTAAGLGENSIVDPYQIYTYDQMVTDIGLLAERYPDLISVYSIGQSVEGRDLIAFDFGHGDREVILISSMHACEHIATNVLMYVVDQYCQGYEAGGGYGGIAYRDILDSVVFHVVPMMNPDGVNLAQNGIEAAKDPDAVAALRYGYYYDYSGWKANINGVDLNRNFPGRWGPRDGVNSPSAANYCGPEPLSEPESKAVQDMLDSTDYDMLVSLHIRGEVIYWIDSDTMELYSEHYPIAKRFGDAFGYGLMGAEDMSTGGGYMVNTERLRTGKFCCTLELCPYIHQDPYPADRFPQVVDNVYSMILVVGEETLKLPEHTGWLPVQEPEEEEPQPEEAEEGELPEEPGTEVEPEIPEETAQPTRPPDAELPVEPTPPLVTEGAEEGAEAAPAADAPADGAEAETAGEDAPDEVADEKTDEEENTEQTEG